MEVKLFMKIEEWGKSTLYSYRYLESVVNAIDNVVKKRGLSSLCMNQASYKNAFDCANQIIDLISRKSRLINLKVIIERALCMLDNNYKRMLILTYFDNLKCEEIAKLMDISIRSYFRHKDLAINAYCSNLKVMGYDEAYFNKKYNDELWMEDNYKMNSFEKPTNLKPSKLNPENKSSLYKTLLNRVKANNAEDDNIKNNNIKNTFDNIEEGNPLNRYLTANKKTFVCNLMKDVLGIKKEQAYDDYAYTI